MLDASSKTVSTPLSEPKQAPQHSTSYPWKVPTAIVVILVCFILLPIVAQIVVSSVPSLLGWDAGRAEQWSNHSTLANFLFVLFAESLTISFLAWFVRRKKAVFAKVVALRKPRWLDVGYALLGAMAYVLLFIVAVQAVSAVLPLDTNKEQAIGFDKNIGGFNLALAFVSLAILPPIVEEMMFRGFLYGTLRARNIRAGMAIIVTSTIFGGLHLFGGSDGSLLWIAFLDTFVLSLVLCHIREKTGSIWATMIVHALKNGFVFLNLFILGVR